MLFSVPCLLFFSTTSQSPKQVNLHFVQVQLKLVGEIYIILYLLSRPISSQYSTIFPTKTNKRRSFFIRQIAVLENQRFSNSQKQIVLLIWILLFLMQLSVITYMESLLQWCLLAKSYMDYEKLQVSLDNFSPYEFGSILSHFNSSISTVLYQGMYLESYIRHDQTISSNILSL